MKTINLLSYSIAVIFTLISTSADAIPAFARKYDAKCSSCHTAYPQLNAAGRKFKEAGYAFPKVKGEESISGKLNWDEVVPISILIKSRPYDKKSTGEKKLRAIHEVEILAAGRLSDRVSGFIELEAEDEDTNERGFEIGVAHGWLTYTHNDALKLQAAWAPLLSTDPYDTYSSGRRLTRGTQSVVDLSFGGADGGKLSSSRQAVSVFGRPIRSFYYSAGVAGLAGDAEGEGFATYYGRIAFDISTNVMVGALAVSGTCDAMIGTTVCATNDRDYTRLGLDSQIDIGGIRLMGSFVAATDDDATATAEEDNNAWYLQGQYAFKDKGRPTTVAILRFDDYEENNGVDTFSAATANVTYYFTENIKGFIEYYDLYDAPTPDDEFSRVTVQAEAAF